MNRQFPALSGLAMLLIVLNHTIEIGTKVPVDLGFPPVEGGMRIFLSVLQGLGVFAVPTFLFISGTFVTYAARGEPPRLTVKFLRRSLAHIWWPYLIWSLVFYGVVLLQFGETYSILGYLKNLAVGYPYHFVPLLLLLYIVSPILVRLGSRYSWWLLVAVGAYQFFLVLLLYTRVSPELRFLVPPGVGRTLADWGIYFPLGLVYGLNSQTLLPRLNRLKGLLAGATAVLFVLGVLHYNGILTVPLAGKFSALAFVLMLPVVDRRSLPGVGFLEQVGKRSYGLYLTHLIFLDLTLLIVGSFAPELFNYQLPLLPLLFLTALGLPFLLMRGLARFPLGASYRYLLG